MRRYPIPATARCAGAVAPLLVLALLLPGGCSLKKGPTTPDLVLFASGSVYGQLETCG